MEKNINNYIDFQYYEELHRLYNLNLTFLLIFQLNADFDLIP